LIELTFALSWSGLAVIYVPADMAESDRGVASEDELGEKWDRCIADTILKTGKLNRRCV